MLFTHFIVYGLSHPAKFTVGVSIRRPTGVMSVSDGRPVTASAFIFSGPTMKSLSTRTPSLRFSRLKLNED